MHNLLVLAFDGLQPASLGPYGNTWIATPNWNRLAERSLLLERCWADAPDLPSIYRALWNGRPSWAPHREGVGPSLPALLQASGRRTLLLTDDARVIEFPAADKFDEQVVVPIPDRDAACAEWTATALAEFFATGAAALDELRTPFAAWWHCGSLGRLWDAPYDYRARLADEEDPAPPEHTHPPYGPIPADVDPDTLLGERQAAAAQVAVLDDCLGAFLDEWDASPLAKSTWLIVLSTRGFPLGEHARWGWNDVDLNRETLHQVLFLCAPDGAEAAERSLQLAQPHDLAANLAARLDLPRPDASAWWSGPPWSAFSNVAESARDRFFVASGERTPTTRQFGIGTEAWWLIDAPVADDATRATKLYYKPDDYFEINDVADRRNDVADALLDELRRWTERLATGDETAPLEPLPDAVEATA
ncbi:MAG: hypothetical protein QM811_18555 [Pirellulales bacterium]